MSADDIEPDLPGDDAETGISRPRAWGQITLIIVGIIIVGTTLGVVLWLLATLTFSLIAELI